MKKQRTWTENELHILEELFPNTEVLIADIAKILNRNEVSIKQKAYSMGLFRPRRPRKPAEQIQYLKENFLHTSRKELEKVLGLSWKEIYRKAYNLGLRVSDRKEAQRKKMHKNTEKKRGQKRRSSFCGKISAQ